MRRSGVAIIALAFCLGGCGAQTGNEAAAGNTAATAAPCPFPNRGWRAAVVLEGTPPEQRIALTGEVGNDRSGRSPMQASGDTPPPTIFLDINSEGAMAAGPGAPAWSEGTTYYAYQPGHSTAVIRCDGREVARVPIAAPR